MKKLILTIALALIAATNASAQEGIYLDINLLTKQIFQRSNAEGLHDGYGLSVRLRKENLHTTAGILLHKDSTVQATGLIAYTPLHTLGIDIGAAIGISTQSPDTIATYAGLYATTNIYRNAHITLLAAPRSNALHTTPYIGLQASFLVGQ